MSDRRYRPARLARSAGASAYEAVLDTALTGIVVLLPVVVTAYVLSMALGILTRVISPVIQTLRYLGWISDLKRWLFFQVLVQIGIYENPLTFLSELIAVLVLVALVFGIGALAKLRYGEHVIDLFDYLIGLVPGVGAVYSSFRRMSDVMLESGVENFREVKLVEFPRDGVFVVGFVTNTSPPSITSAAGVDGMTTLFLPLAPNPVMGGFLTYIPDDRIHDVELSVQEAVQLVVTSGIATESPDEDGFRELAKDELQDLDLPGAGRVAESEDAETGAGSGTGSEVDPGTDD
jgi:uncharacterized membrane protein